ncbi:hypothetical protein CFOL_v3_31811 [Cephalotus follicularis]|uniref:Uncharacterized protein n=1 Tax=Cephalotus follicularis TaxID=3775 RepID=A0A1Q3D801_CEPFO|nr:hypothetical protein CFOL_v3_31811 [Cephalotus follicularis]
MTEKAPLKALSPQDWESLIDDFQYGGPRRHKWDSLYPITSLIDVALTSLLKRDFPLKIPIILFLEQLSDSIPTFDFVPSLLSRLLETLRSIVQSPIDGIHVSYLLKEQMMVSATSILISIDSMNNFEASYTESLVELLLTVINRPNHGPDRHTRGIACHCLRELERFYPCLLSEIAGHFWSLCQSERTHACQCYILMFAGVIYNIVNQHLNVSILNTSAPMVPFSVPLFMLLGSEKDVSGFNYKELRRAMAFLLEWPHVLTPCGMMEFMGMIVPLAVALELQASMLKVQFFGMIYSFDPMLCHVVLMMCLNFWDTFDGLEQEIVQRLMLVSKETQHHLVFRLLAIHWLLALLNKLMLSREVGSKNLIVEMGLRFYPAVFDPLALKSLKLDLLSFCSVCLDRLKSESVLVEGVAFHMSVVKLFEDSLVSVSAFKWLPPWSSETVVALRSFHKFFIGASSHSDTDTATNSNVMESNIFHTLQGMLVDFALEFPRLVPVIVAFVDRILCCHKHRLLGECLLQAIDKHMLSRVKIDYRLVSYFSIFDRIAENDTIPPRGLLDLLTKFMSFLVDKHDADTGLKSWSQGSKVIGICRTMLMHHHSSRLFLWLSHLLAFTCLHFPDLDVRDHARIYLRMLICVPGVKLKGILNLGEQLLTISPSPHSSSFFNVQSPLHHQVHKKSKNLLSYIHLERVTPLLVKQSWSLSLSTLAVGSQTSGYLESIRDSEPPVGEKELDDGTDFQTMPETERQYQPQEPLRVMDSKISEILGTLRRHFSCIPDFRHMPGLKVRISCSLRFESEPFKCLCGGDSPTSGLDGPDSLPAIYATVLKFSSSAPYGSISSCHIPFLLGEPPRNDCFSGQTVSLDIIPVENGSGEGESFRAPVTIDLEPQEPTPGLVDVLIETNTENCQIIHGQLQSITVGIEDMFLKAIVPSEIPEDAVPGYCSDLFHALWDACGTSSNIGRETFPLKGSKGVAAISGTRSVKLLEVPADSLIRSIEHHLAPFVVGVIGEQLVNIVKDGGMIGDAVCKAIATDSFLDGTTSVPDFDRGPLHLTYVDDESGREIHSHISKRNIGCFLILIFLPPRFHLLFQMEVCDVSTLVRIRTDHWPCLAYIDDFLEALFLA